MAKGDRTSVAKRAACLVAYADTGSIEAAARAAGINHQTARGIVDNNVDTLAETKKPQKSACVSSWTPNWIRPRPS